MKQLCRGCLSDLETDRSHSFSWPEIKNLFEECSSVKILPEEIDLPLKICWSCYKKCEEWDSFRTMCQETDRFIHSSSAFPRGNHQEMEIGSSPEIIEDSTEKMETAAKSFELHELNFGELVPDEDHQMRNGRLSNLIQNLNAGLSTAEEIKPDLSVDIKWDCPACKKQLSVSTTLRDHLNKEHIDEKNPVCPICGIFFNRSASIYPHFLSRHMDKQPSGDDDDDGVEEERPLAKRLVAKEKSGNISKDCPHCGEWVHDWFFHSTEIHKKCPICSKGYSSVARVRRHLLKHVKATDGLTADRRIIPKKRNSNEKKVKKPSDTGKEGKSCPLCQKEVPSLFFHLRTKHTRRGDKKCPLCFKEFHSNPIMRQHLVTHTDESPYECKFCNTKCRQSSYLKIHIAAKHPEKAECYEKTNMEMCPVCGVQQSNKLEHETHVRLHKLDDRFKNQNR